MPLNSNSFHLSPPRAGIIGVTSTLGLGHCFSLCVQHHSRADTLIVSFSSHASPVLQMWKPRHSHTAILINDKSLVGELVFLFVFEAGSHSNPIP
jgi:hypothetical protein